MIGFRDGGGSIGEEELGQVTKDFNVKENFMTIIRKALYDGFM